MKKLSATLLFVGASALGLSACTSTQVGTVAGGAAGAGIGYAVSGGSALGTVIGAGAGALIGNQIGQNQDRRNYYYYGNRPYYRYY